MGIIDCACDEKQKVTLREIHEKIQGLYEGHDNHTVYALTGLISELTQPGFQDRHYVWEKVILLFGAPPKE